MSDSLVPSVSHRRIKDGLLTHEGNGQALFYTRPLMCSAFTDISTLYELGREIGRGANGVVTKCIDRKSGRAMACKSVSKANLQGVEDLNTLGLEISALKIMRHHPYVVRLHQVLEDTAVRN